MDSIGHFIDTSSDDDEKSMDGMEGSLPFGCSRSKPIRDAESGSSTERSRDPDVDSCDIEIIDKEESPHLSLLKEQINIQKNLFAAVAQSLVDNKSNANALNLNISKICDHLERISMGSMELLRRFEMREMEEARHHRAMENMAKEELEISNMLLEIKQNKYDQLQKNG